jgi:glyoxylase-like metal-dependent hydrolase (beta-lactamase superfamily II)
MTRKFLAVAVLAILFVSVASAQDAKTVIANATKAMGYEGLNTIQYSGPISREGQALGQWLSPTKGWHHNTVRDFTRFIDLTAGTSQRNGTSKREGDTATGMLPGGAGLDPSAAPGVAGTTNIAPTATFVQKLDITLSPPGFLKMAAAAPNATVRNQGGRRLVTFDYPGVMAPSGIPYKVTGTINNQNMLEKVETAYEDNANPHGYIFGDILVEQNYADYKDFGGVKFPTKITQLRAGVVYSDATIADVKANGTAPAAIVPAAGAGGRGGGGGAPGAPGAPGGGGQGGRGGAGGAPGAGAGGAAPAGGAPGAGGRGGGGGAPAAGGAPPAGGAQGGRGGGGGGQAAAPGPRKLADGVFVIIAGGSRSLAIDMKDGIVLVDAPLAQIDVTVAQAKAAIPNKQISHVITTHLHFDHVGGMRTALADGTKEVTLVTNDMSKDVIEKWFSTPRTLQAVTPAPGAAAAPAPAPAPAAPAAGGGQGGRGGGAAAAPAPWPDALAKSGKKVKFQYVKDKWTLKDDNHTIEVHAIKGALHGEDMVVVYLPKEKIIFESDAYNPAPAGLAATNPTANGGQLAFQKLLAAELDRLKLDYETIVAGHTREATKQDLMVAIGRVPPPPPAAGAPAAPAGGGGRGQ